MNTDGARKGRNHALVLRWQFPDAPLPVRVLDGNGSRESAWHELHSAAPMNPTSDQPFDFSLAMHRLVMDIAIRCPDFAHLQVPRILVSAIQARGRSNHGLLARVTPLRFRGGALKRMRRGVPYQIQRFFLGEHEYLYLLTFCLPRFLNQDFDQKLVTLFHELWHISPAFDGDLRRHEGRYHVHTHCKREYDERMVHFARDYLAGKPDPELYSFLRLDFNQLQQRHGSVTSIVVPRPKMIPLV